MPKFRRVRSLMSRPFWCPTSATVRPLKRAEPGDDRRVVAARPVAVQLDEVLEQALDVVEGVRPLLMARELDGAPDVLVGRLRPAAARAAARAARARPRSRRRGAAARAACRAAPEAELGLAARRHRSPPSSAIGEEPEHARGELGQVVARDDASTWPWRRFDSARPKSSGSFSRVVCCTTRGPAKDISAPGSATTTSPREAKVASRPPVVGCARIEMKRAARVLHVLDGHDRLRQLHEREDPLLHAGAARRCDGHERDAVLGGRVAGARELLADGAAHRAAHEGEVHDGELARVAADRAAADRPSRRRARSSSRPPRAARRTGAGRRRRAGRPSGRRRPPRRTSPRR